MPETLYKKIDNSRWSIDEHPPEPSLIEPRFRNPWSLSYLPWINGGLLILNLTAALLLFKANYIGFRALDYWEYGISVVIFSTFSGNILTVCEEPLQNVISYDREFINLEFGQPSVYVEASGPEVDDKWNGISALPGRGTFNAKMPAHLRKILISIVGTIRVQKSELDRMNLSTIQLADGSYVATLDVFHQLHCLVRLLNSWKKPDGIERLKSVLQDRLRKALRGTDGSPKMAIHLGKKPLFLYFSPPNHSLKTLIKPRKRTPVS